MASPYASRTLAVTRPLPSSCTGDRKTERARTKVNGCALITNICLVPRRKAMETLRNFAFTAREGNSRRNGTDKLIFSALGTRSSFYNGSLSVLMVYSWCCSIPFRCKSAMVDSFAPGSSAARCAAARTAIPSVHWQSTCHYYLMVYHRPLQRAISRCELVKNATEKQLSDRWFVEELLRAGSHCISWQAVLFCFAALLVQLSCNSSLLRMNLIMDVSGFIVRVYVCVCLCCCTTFSQHVGLQWQRCG